VTRYGPVCVFRHRVPVQVYVQMGVNPAITIPEQQDNWMEGVVLHNYYEEDMNKLTQEEFKDRTLAVARARRIFIDSGVAGGNITTAFTLYQEVLAEQERAVIINTLTGGNRPPALFDNFDRPKCPDCGASLMFRPLKDNPEGIKVQLVCENQACDTVLNSEMSIEDWAKELQSGLEQTKAE
jgi:hypothetical protein